jgi:hypothetical protein
LMQIESYAFSYSSLIAWTAHTFNLAFVRED